MEHSLCHNTTFTKRMGYRGKKDKFMNIVCPALMEDNPKTIADAMAGTHSIGMAVKQNVKVYANDIQNYSQAIGKCVLSPVQNLDPLPIIAKPNFFTNTEKFWSEIFFTQPQARDIDRIRESIYHAKTDEATKACYMNVLLYTVEQLARMPGQYSGVLKPDNPKSIARSKLNAISKFQENVQSFVNDPTKIKHQVYNLDVAQFLATIPKVDVIYHDPPYGSHQYTDNYNVPEAISNLDPVKEQSMTYNPKSKIHALQERKTSPFSSKAKALSFTDQIMEKTALKTNRMVWSYSTDPHNSITLQHLLDKCNKYFHTCRVCESGFVCHTQQKGTESRKIKEVVIIGTQSKLFP